MQHLLKLIILLSILLNVQLYAQDITKIPLSHDVYDDWKTINKPIISNDGQWLAYELKPFSGDGSLIVHHIKSGTNDTVQRAYDATFSPTNNYLVFKIKAPESVVRKAKLEKKKAKDMPKDSLGIWLLKDKTIQKHPDVESYKMPEEESAWFAFTQTLKDDTSNTKKRGSKESEKKEDKSNIKTAQLFIVNPLTKETHIFERVNDYNISKNGFNIAFVENSDTKKNEVNVMVFNTSTTRTNRIFRREGEAKNLCLDGKGAQIAFIFSGDTTKNKNYGLYIYADGVKQARKIIDHNHSSFADTYVVSEHATLYFSEDGSVLYWGYGLLLPEKTKDSIPDDEQVALDLWSWTDELLQSQQLAELKKERKRSYLAAYHISDNKFVRLGNENIPDVRIYNKGNAPFALGITAIPYQRTASWEPPFKDYYTINLKNGKAEKILEKQRYSASLSPAGNYMIYFENNDSLWYTYNIKTKKHTAITKKIETDFYNTCFDRPENPPPYGIAGWFENDAFVLIYDKYDIWKISPHNGKEPVNLTKNFHSGNTINRYEKLDREAEFIKKEAKLLIKYINDDTKEEGFYYLNTDKLEKPEIMMKGNCRYFAINKAKNSNTLFFRRSTFTEFPDLWVSDTTFNNPQKISDANPQQKKYLWGSVELIHWEFNDKPMKGMLYKPENFSSANVYPMVTYFYERTAQTLHSHYIPSPSRSVINFPLYTSNGYLIFVPDIAYDIGSPGESALNTVLSGVYHLMDKGFVDGQRLGLQGQSWGGYQTAYIITRTNLFKAAMAGAPVTNMTSAYGGIRRRTGINRIHQYEIGQSRIGATLWERRDLYIENSPLFYADRIETPLLMMSNDNDGAVPWEQGIELFLAMRRLDKPVWMLNYNNDEHNLAKNPNRKDLSIRMLQFFDHYLKDAPAPAWMKYGINALEKGSQLKYELIEEQNH